MNGKTAFAVLVLASLLVLGMTSRSQAVAYVAMGGGYTKSFAKLRIDNTYYDADYDTVKFGSGFSAEAQFGWEVNPYVDMEGALRYGEVKRASTRTDDVPEATGFRSVGFEGGMRLHPERGFTNSCPYIRAGVGSYSPSIQFNGSAHDVPSKTVLGYYAGVGYMHEVTGKLGLDIRATFIQYKAFTITEDTVELRSRFLSIALSLIIF